MPAYFEDASLRDMGTLLVNQYHPSLSVLQIGFLFREKGAWSRNTVVPAKTLKCDARNANFHGIDFIIEVAHDVWVQANDDFRRAILDHELCSIGVTFESNGTTPVIGPDGRIKTYVRKPDISEYSEVMERHGAYHLQLRKFLQAFVAYATKDQAADDTTPTPATEENDQVESADTLELLEDVEDIPLSAVAEPPADPQDDEPETALDLEEMDFTVVELQDEEDSDLNSDNDDDYAVLDAELDGYTLNEDFFATQD